MSVGITQGNALGIYVIKASLTPSEVATIVTVEQDFTVVGVKVGDAISVCPPGITASGSICAVRVKAANVVAMQFVNPSAGSVTPLAGVHTFIVYRPEGQLASNTISD